MLVKLWGVRGSSSTPITQSEYKEKLIDILRIVLNNENKGLKSDQIPSILESLPPNLRFTFGGNTTCVSVSTNDIEIPYILDCGTGIRVLGDELMKGPCGRGEGNINIFLTHTHWDHIQGLPYFKPLYLPGNKINFYSSMEDLESRLIYQQQERFFPVTFEQTGAAKSFHYISEGEILTLDGNIRLDTLPLKHPGGSTAFRFKKGSEIFIFATDAEFTGEDMNQLDNYKDFFYNADLLILDAQYSLNDSFGKFDWGHTSNTMAVNCGFHWQIKNLVLTHHEPAASDADLYKNYLAAVEHKQNMKVDRPRLFLAREGMSFRVGEDIN